MNLLKFQGLFQVTVTLVLVYSLSAIFSSLACCYFNSHFFKDVFSCIFIGSGFSIENSTHTTLGLSNDTKALVELCIKSFFFCTRKISHAPWFILSCFTIHAIHDTYTQPILQPYPLNCCTTVVLFHNVG